MKVYVAAPWVRKDDARRFAAKLTAIGIDVTSRWFNHKGSATDSTGIASPIDEIRHQAHEDIADVRRADMFVVLNLERSEGKAFETAIAYSSSIPIMSVGPRGNIFQTLGAELATEEEAIDFLEARLANLSHI